MTDQPAQGASSGAIPFSAYEFLIAGRYLRTKRKHGGVALIAMISFFGIMLAVTALIAVTSIMNGFRTELFAQLLGFQPHVYVDTYDMGEDRVDQLVRDVEAIEGVVSATPVVQGQVMATSDAADAFIQVLAIAPEDLARLDVIRSGDDPMSRTGLTQGDLSEFGLGRNGGDVIVLGQGVATRLRVQAGDYVTFLTARGQSGPFGVTPRRKAYYVGAVLAAGVSTIDDALAFMPLEQGRLFFNRAGATDMVQIRLSEPDLAPAYLQPVRTLAGQNSTVFDYTQLDPAFFNALQFERIAMAMILSFVVIIAALNITSGLVMLVKNKGRDIGVLRTMGMTRAGILRVFILIGAMIGTAGMIFGVLLGVLFVVNIDPIQDFVTWVMTLFDPDATVWDPSVYYLYRVPALLNWTEVGFVALFGFVLSVLVTLPPAAGAANLDPVEALRYE